MPNWIPISEAHTLENGSGREVVVGDKIVALFRVDDEFFALDGVCCHQGGPLGKGDLQGCVVTCPWHGWQFNVRDGVQQATPTIVQPSFPVKVENGEVFIDLN